MPTTKGPWPTTLALLAVAGALAGLLWLTRPAPRAPSALRAEQGQPLAPALTDPLAVKSLEVIAWDDTAARPRGFKVAFENNRWVIPSAFNYPADASRELAAAASSFIGLTRDRVITDDPAQHARFNLIDPSDERNPSPTGRGTRVTLRDAAGAPLADLIIGSAPAPADAEQPGAPTSRYVRLANTNRVYTTALTLAFSTRFQDWINQDLLQTPPQTINRVDITRYTIDERTGAVQDPLTLSLTRNPPPPAPDPNNPAPAWSLSTQRNDQPATPLAEGESLDTATIDALLQRISQLKIIAVRPKPPNLARLLSAAASGTDKSLPPLTLADQASMQSQGFFLSADGPDASPAQLLANEGQLSITDADGVRTTIWLGELALDQRTKDQAAGAASPSSADQPQGRAIMITVDFDPSIIGPAPAKPQTLLDLEAAEASATDEQKAQLAQARANHQALLTAHTARVDAAKARAAAQSARFAEWYYIASAEDLSALRPAREALLTPKP
jgi:hypothetical protein